MKTAKQYIAEKLRSLQQEKNITATEVAREADIPRKRYASYLEARAEPRVLTLKRICKVLKTTVDKLLKDAPPDLVG